MRINLQRSSIALCAVFITTFAVVGNVGLIQASATNVALNTTVTLHGEFFIGGWGGGMTVSEDTIVDGVFFPRHHQWDVGPVWWDSTDGSGQFITINLGATYYLESFIVQADDNDAYVLSYWDLASSSWVVAWDVPNYDTYPDPANWGMQTRPNPDDNTEQYVLPTVITTNALKFEGNMDDGDGLFAVSEIQAFGTPVPSGVPLFSSALLILPLAVLVGVLVVLNRRKAAL